MKRDAPPKHILDVLQSTFRNLKIEKPMKKHAVWNIWEEIVGKTIAQKARPSHFSGDTLVIQVTSHSWMTELTLMKPVILENIRKKIEHCPIQNLRFELRQTPLL